MMDERSCVSSLLRWRHRNPSRAATLSRPKQKDPDLQNSLGIMARILIVYSSPNGHTSKISGVIANQLEGEGHRVDLFEAERAIREQVHPAS